MAKQQFKKGDEVSYVDKQSGKTILCTVDGVATNGDVWVVWKDGPLKVRQLKPYMVTMVKPAEIKPAPLKKQVFRWVCLECGKRHNAHTCPQCGSDEKIYNTDADLDPSVLLGGSSAEPYIPRDDA